ncbi:MULTISPECIES: ABC transporter substrate-binding protein [Cobetia]|uniref:ABC transporter substrate-binding protein n=2 Tax=Cobetia TaxID=204286 RepID=UPI0020C68BA0|nr:MULTISPECIES: ABC transporter substrate-binding protein [Cobetia]MDI4661317.1 ABC transporter substrate-binding protein [Cobetia sp. BMC6]MDL2190787.1 ABC transporter substrate-binding protein [Cobetia sp. LC6]
MTVSSTAFTARGMTRPAWFKQGLMATLAVALMGASLSAEARSVETAYGELDIEGTPQRVVTLYEGALDVAVASQVTPLGAVTTRGGDGVASYIQPQVPDIKIVGTPREFNLESIVALKPDLILAPPGLDKTQYQLMSRLAPTIVPSASALSQQGWKEQSRVYAEALGETAEAELETRLAAIDAHTARLKAEMTTPETASLVRRMPGGLMAMSDQLFATGLMAASGYELVGGDLVKPGRPHSDPLSDENMARIDAQTIFLATLDDSSDAAVDALAAQPAFQRLETADRDSLVGVNGQLWTSASGPLAAEALLKDIDRARDDG